MVQNTFLQLQQLKIMIYSHKSQAVPLNGIDLARTHSIGHGDPSSLRIHSRWHFWRSSSMNCSYVLRLKMKPLNETIIFSLGLNEWEAVFACRGILWQQARRLSCHSTPISSAVLTHCRPRVLVQKRSICACALCAPLSHKYQDRTFSVGKYVSPHKSTSFHFL